MILVSRRVHCQGVASLVPLRHTLNGRPLADMAKSVILSGIRPTGQLHLGNYLGALTNFIRLQKQYTCYFFIADLHALNEPGDPKTQYHKIIDVAATFLAAGLDPKRSVLFVQSHVPAHSELAVILTNVVPVSYLFRMTQYKDKAGKDAQSNANAGLLYYPVLMAADILLYHPEFVPVGDDQDQHVELARDIAGFFNRRFTGTLPQPKTLHTRTPRVMSLLDPSKKMSKSLGGDHCLNLDDSPDEIRRKLSRAVTDSGDGKGEGVTNLLLLLREFADASTVAKFTQAQTDGTIRYVELKQALADAVAAHLAPLQLAKNKLLAKPSQIEKLLASGAKRAAKVAKATLAEIHRRAGLRR